MRVEIERTEKSEHQTLGTLRIFDDKGFPFWQCKTLELPDKDNKQRVSCIPEGKYKVLKRESAKYGWHFHITGVPNRTLILIHSANFVRQLLGCIAVGLSHTDIDGDGLRDVTSSKNTLKGLNDKLPDSFELTILESEVYTDTCEN